jgi:hypothetical protein
MKRVLLLMTVLCSGVVLGQNVQDQKISFKYVQWPTNPIDNSISDYEVIFEKGYEQANEDSLTINKTKVEAAELKFNAEMDVWNEQKVVIDRAWLTDMMNWQKQVNAGSTTAVRPAPVTYTPRPEMDIVNPPILTEEIDENTVTNTVRLDGYSKSSGGATVTVKILGFQHAKISEKRSGSGTSTKYTYSFTYRMPVQIKVEGAGSTVLDHRILDGYKTFTKTFTTSYEFKLWWLDNKDGFWKSRQREMVNYVLGETNKYLNEKCGFPEKARGTEVFTVKKFKDHDYSDLILAYTEAKQGYDVLYRDKNKGEAYPKLEKAISIWETALKESNPSDNKSRIEKKITALLYANLAEAYMWKDDFSTAELYINKGTSAGVSKYKNVCNKLKPLLNDLKMRYQTNH